MKLLVKQVLEKTFKGPNHRDSDCRKRSEIIDCEGLHSSAQLQAKTMYIALLLKNV